MAWLSVSSAHAQLNKTSEWQAGAFYGPFISRAPGFNEVLTANGFRLNKGMKYYRPEITYMQADKDAEEYSFLSLSLKNPVSVQDLEGIRPFFYVGLHRSMYSNPFSGGEVSGNGFHLAAGIEYLIAGNAFFRTDLFYGNGPNKQLLVSLGLQIDFGGNNANQNSN